MITSPDQLPFNLDETDRGLAWIIGDKRFEWFGDHYRAALVCRVCHSSMRLTPGDYALRCVNCDAWRDPE